MRRVGTAYVAGNVNVVEGPQRRALREAARQQHLLQREIRMFSDVALKLFPQSPRLRAILVGLVARKVYLFIREADDFCVVDVKAAHPSSSPCPCLVRHEIHV